MTENRPDSTPPQEPEDEKTVHPTGDSTDEAAWKAFIDQIKSRGPTYSRYEMRGEIARGGMGAIHRVYDNDVRRPLAMKVILGKGDAEPTGQTPDVDSRSLGRFLEEAQVTGQLDHPGIVPVHELGVDEDGHVYFTMKLVKGEDLRSVFERVHDPNDDEWNETRALSVLLRVCEAMAYAHDKGVLHRDLKPANVMVGRFGETYVMDWGLARVLGQEDHKDIRLQTQPTPSSMSVHTQRKDAAHQSPDSPLITMDGDVVGTPAYMSPEQAAGEQASIGPQTDIYSIGAMLYHLIVGHPPYLPPGSIPHPHAVWNRVLEGPPQSLASGVHGTQPELAAICNTAMERDSALRYESASSLAADLRSYLEGRAVSAYATNTASYFIYALTLFVRRNKVLSLVVAASITTLLTFAYLDIARSRQRAFIAERATYNARVRSVPSLLRSGQLREAKRVLGLCSPELRDWEWYHLSLRSDSARLIADDAYIHQKPNTPPRLGDGLRTSTTDLPKDFGTNPISGQSVLITRDHVYTIESDDRFLFLYDPPPEELHGWSIVEWSRSTGEPVRSLPFNEGQGVHIELNGNRLWATTVHTLYEIDSSSFSVLSKTGLPDEATPANRIAVTADGSVIAISTFQEAIALFDTKTRTMLHLLRPEWGHGKEITDIDFSPDDSLLVAGGSDMTLRIWNSATGELAAFRHLDSFISNVAFGPDGSRVYASIENQIHAFEAQTLRPIAVLSGHNRYISLLDIDEASNSLVSRDAETIRIWDLATIPAVSKISYQYQVQSIAADASDEFLVMGDSSDSEGAMVYSARTGEPLRVLSTEHLWITSVDVSRNGTIVTGSFGETEDWGGSGRPVVQAWHTDGSILSTMADHVDRVSAVSAGKSVVISSSMSGSVIESHIESGQVICTYHSGGPAITSVDSARNGEWILAGSYEGDVYLWKGGILEPVLRLRHPPSVTCVSLHTDASFGASGSSDGTITLWDLPSGSVRAVLRGHEDEVMCLALNPDGTRLASGSFDETVRVWDTADGSLVAVLTGHSSYINCVAFNSNGHRLLSGAHDGAVLIWESRREDASLMLQSER